MGRENGSGRPRGKCAHDQKGRGEVATTTLGGLAEVPRHHLPGYLHAMGPWHLRLPRHLHVPGQVQVQLRGEGHWLRL